MALLQAKLFSKLLSLHLGEFWIHKTRGTIGPQRSPKKKNVRIRSRRWSDAKTITCVWHSAPNQDSSECLAISIPAQSAAFLQGIVSIILLEAVPPLILQLRRQLCLLKIRKMVHQRSKLARVNVGQIYVYQSTKKHKCCNKRAQEAMTKPTIEKHLALHIHIIWLNRRAFWFGQSHE